MANTPNFGDNFEDELFELLPLHESKSIKEVRV